MFIVEVWKDFRVGSLNLSPAATYS